MKVSLNYHVEELVHPAIIDTWGVAKVAKYLSIYLPWFVHGQQSLREFAGVPLVVNNYMWDSDYKKFGWKGIQDRTDLFINSGIRDMRYPLNKGFSAHYFGATDSKPKGMSPVDLQNHILANESNLRVKYIVRMENAEVTKTWLHCQFGVRNGGIAVFNP